MLVSRSQTAASVSALRYNSRAVSVLSYLSQLLPLPQGFGRVEKWALHKVLHLPYNALSLNPLFYLHEAGGPTLRSVLVESYAARLRSSVSTAMGWQQHLLELETTALDFLPMQRSLLGKWWPAFWDSEPFALHLSEAYKLFPHNPAAHAALVPRAALLCNPHGAGLHFKPQRVAGALLLPAILPGAGSVAAVCTVRLGALLPAIRKHLNVPLVSALLELGKKSSPHIAMCLVKSLANAWCTSHRLHEQVRLPCVFGCLEACDSLQHYWSCARLWGVVSAALGLQLPECVLGKLGFPVPTMGNVHAIFVAYHAYHTVKISHRDSVQTAIESQDFSTTLSVALSSTRAALLLIRTGHSGH